MFESVTHDSDPGCGPISGPVFTPSTRKNSGDGYRERGGGVLSVAALCASALEEGWEGLQPVKATSTNCVIDHSRGQ